MRVTTLNNIVFKNLDKGFVLNFYVFSKRAVIVSVFIFLVLVVFYILAISYATLLGAKIASYENAITDLKSRTADFEERILNFDKELLSDISKYNFVNIKEKTFLQVKRTLTDAR